MNFLSDYPEALLFVKETQGKPEVQDAFQKILFDLFQDLEVRVEPDLITKELENNQLAIGTKKDIEEYITKKDMHPFVQLLEDNGVYGVSLHLMLGHYYQTIMSVLISRILPSLGAKKAKPTPEALANIKNMFGGKPAEV